MNIDRDIIELIALTRGPACNTDGSLVPTDKPAQFDLSMPLSRITIRCEQCDEPYPMTEDLIPIIWSKSLKQVFLDINKDPGDDSTTVSNMSANMTIYDKNSENYSKHARQKDTLSRRVKKSVEILFPDGKTEGALHLDWACGPGHVLSWLKEFGFRQIGLDVSLVNLRNARHHTGCRVVCGDASDMPFSNDTFQLVTEASALHHILDWKAAIRESCRITSADGAIVMDAEPSDLQMAWSPLAIAVFNARFPVYKVLSYFMKDKYIFRDTKQAKLNLLAEIHHQPGTGFPLDVLRDTFKDGGFQAEVVMSPDAEMKSRPNVTWKSILLNVLSARNPWNPKYGSFTTIATTKPKS